MALALVQKGAAASAVSGAPGVTLGSAPTNGNVLVAMGYSLGGPDTPHQGWFPVIRALNAAQGEYQSVYLKYAQAGESATQEPDATNLPAWALAMWEFSGASGVLSQDIAEAYAQYLGTTASAAITPFNNANANETVLICASQASSSAATLSIAGGGAWTADASAQGTADGFNQSTFSWHQALATAGNNVDPTISSTTSFRLFDAVIGLTTSPTTGTPNVVQENWGAQNSGASVSVTLDAAPALGHLMTATVNSNAVPTAALGWTQDAQAVSGSQYMTTFWKYAGASESATQTPCSAPAGTTLLAIIKEHSGVSGTWAADHVATHIGQETTAGGASPSPVAFSTGQANECVSGVVMGAALSDAVIVTGGSGVPSSAYLNQALGGAIFAGQSTFALEPTLSTAFSQSFTGTTWFAYAYIEIGVGSSSGSASGALGSGLTIGDMTATAQGQAAGVAQGVLGSPLTIGAMTGFAVPDAAVKSSKVVAYAALGPPDASIAAVKVVGGAVTGPPDAEMIAAKVVAYAVLGAPPPRRKRSVRVNIFRGTPE